jgi:glycosyltransferase involved in cell wall biosynthesis
MAKLVCMLRVKDGILFIEDWLSNMERLMDEIVVVDNGSTDGTLKILSAHPKIAEIAQTEGFNEGRDKLMLYDMARKRKPDWCIWLDVDEIFENRVKRSDLDNMMGSKLYSEWRFRRFAMRKNKTFFEANWDDILAIARPSRNMWKEQPNAHFSGAFIHDGGVHGLKGLFCPSNLRILHLAASPDGYKEYRIQKYAEAKELDKDEERKKMYDINLAIEINDDAPMWQWYDFKDRPIFIRIQNIFFTCLMLYSYVVVIPKKIIRKCKK